MINNVHKNDAGKTSYNKVDVAKVFRIIDIKPGESFLDIGCGKGEYTLAAAKYVGETGYLYALDFWEGGIEELKRMADLAGIKNLNAYVGDISQGLVLETKSIDKCLMSAVLHGLRNKKVLDIVMEEISRVLKKTGQFIIIEWKKKDGPPGPAVEARLAPEELEGILKPFGFKNIITEEAGEYFYISVFTYEYIL